MSGLSRFFAVSGNYRSGKDCPQSASDQPGTKSHHSSFCPTALPTFATQRQWLARPGRPSRSGRLPSPSRRIERGLGRSDLTAGEPLPLRPTGPCCVPASHRHAIHREVWPEDTGERLNRQAATEPPDPWPREWRSGRRWPLPNDPSAGRPGRPARHPCSGRD
jgi:hypothetical protein